MHNLILVGNPNVGKTTLFNTMTKSHEKASNWHGVTVAEKLKKFKFNGDEFAAIDLPGMYSLHGYSNEEKIAKNFLEKNKNDLVINICDANNLERNLNLTKELIVAGFKVLLAVNMSNELSINSKLLAEALGVRVVLIDARKKKSINKLMGEVENLVCEKNVKPNTNMSQLVNNKKLNETILTIKKAEPYKISDKIDKVILNKFAFFLIFILTVFAVFFLTFGPVGEAFSGVFNWFFSKIFDFLRKIISCTNISVVVRNFFNEGVINSLSAVCSFLPQILLLTIFINLLEDIGFMSRLAFMFDGLLKNFGLTGKSLFSLMMGYGCTTSAVMTTRNLENKNLRKRTALLLPFSTCSAKLPVFLVIASLFFDKYKYLFVFLLYVFAILISLICAIIFKKFIKDEEDVFILEMPKYRVPYLKKVLQDSTRVAMEFLLKVGTLILFFSSALWLLQNFSLSFDYLQGSNYEKSILYAISSRLAFIFKPIGLGSAGIVASLILGIVAKELIVVGLAMINGADGLILGLGQSLVDPSSLICFSSVTSVVFLVFILLYSPCISALGAIKNEFGRKTAIFVFAFQFVVSYVVSFFVYRALISSWMIYLLLSFIVLDIFGVVMLKLYRKKKSCRGNCNVCGKIFSKN